MTVIRLPHHMILGHLGDGGSTFSDRSLRYPPGIPVLPRLARGPVSPAGRPGPGGPPRRPAPPRRPGFACAGGARDGPPEDGTGRARLGRPPGDAKEPHSWI